MKQLREVPLEPDQTIRIAGLSMGGPVENLEDLLKLKGEAGGDDFGSHQFGDQVVAEDVSSALNSYLL